MEAIKITRLEPDNARHASDLLALLEHYARDPMGGGVALPAQVRQELLPRLRTWPGYVGFLAHEGARAVGLINCFTGFSTFTARPLLNVHDIVVDAERRGRGIGRLLLGAAEGAAREAGCCKLTLEVLSNNSRAMRCYLAEGYAPYVLDPAAGQALLLQKWLVD